MTSASFDAFTRFRTSGTGQRLDVEFIYDKQPNFFDEVTNNGTVTHNANTRDLTLSLSDANSGSYALMRSHPAPYTPGNSQLIDMTGTLNLAGISGGTTEVFLRSSIAGTALEQTIPQSAWDDLRLDTGEIDWTKSHIFTIDFQSLKVGLIRFFINASGEVRRVAAISNDNVRSSGFWQLPSLPAYWRLYNDATYTYMELGFGDESNAVGFRHKVAANASATMRAICCTVKSEGGAELQSMPGLPRCADTAQTPVTVAASLIPLLSIRPQTTFGGLANLGIALPKGFSVEASNPIRLVGIHNGTLTGASFAPVTDSIMEYDTAATAVSGGSQVFAGYYTSSSNNRATSAQGLLGKTVLWNRQGSQTGILTLAAVRTGGSSSSTLAALQWEEIR